MFWASHEPCQKSWSTQYEAILFFDGPEQERLARESIAEIEKQRRRIVRTDVRPVARFHRAEDYHQKYALRRDRALYRDVRALFDTEREFIDSTAAARVNAYCGGDLTFAKLREALAAIGLKAVGERSLERVVPLPKPESRPTSRPQTERTEER